MDGREEISAGRRRAGVLARIHVRREHRPHLHRRRDVFPERGRQPDARQEGPSAARPLLFQSNTEVTAPNETWGDASRRNSWEDMMLHRSLLGPTVLASALFMACAAQA